MTATVPSIVLEEIGWVIQSCSPQNLCTTDSLVFEVVDGVANPLITHLILVVLKQYDGN